MSSKIPFSSPDFRLTSILPSFSIDEDSSPHSILTLQSGPKTDWWRTAKGSVPESNVNRRSGPVFSLPLDRSKGAFKAGVWMRGDLKERFQQVCLFLYAGEHVMPRNTNQTNWLKAGVELEDGKENVGCVVTSPFSDWSISPTTSPGISYSNPKSTSDQWLYIQISTHSANSPDISIHAFQAESSSGKGKDSLPPNSRPRDEDLVLIRECRGFNVLFTNEDGKKENEKWSIGVMTCGPLTEDHTEGKFADFWLEYS